MKNKILICIFIQIFAFENVFSAFRSIRLRFVPISTAMIGGLRKRLNNPDFRMQGPWLENVLNSLEGMEYTEATALDVIKRFINGCVDKYLEELSAEERAKPDFEERFGSLYNFFGDQGQVTLLKDALKESCCEENDKNYDAK